MWAQAMEALGDHWGRGVRYGQGPERPDLPIMEPFSTRGAFTRELIELAEGVEDLEKLDNLSQRELDASERTTVERLKARFRGILETLVQIIKTGRLEA
jgi:hypothetical protein